MNKLFFIIGVLTLAGCSEPLPQNQWAKNVQTLDEVKGFENCVMTEINRTTGSYPIFLVRCPTSSMAQYAAGGKSKTHIAAAVVETEQADVTTEIAKLEKQIKAQDELIQQQREIIHQTLTKIKSNSK